MIHKRIKAQKKGKQISESLDTFLLSNTLTKLPI